MRFHLPPDWAVPARFTERLGDSAGRQRAMLADGHLLLILHEPPTPGVAERSARAFWRNPAGDWTSKGPGDGPHALKRHVAEFAERVEALEARWQSAGAAADYFELLRELAPLHRTTRNLHAVLQEARELVPGDRDLINLRDRVGDIERTIELLHGDARNGLDFTIAHQAERQAEQSFGMAMAAYRLNVLAAVFFPIVTLGAVFGMHLDNGLRDTATPAHFWGLLAVALLGGVLLARAIARKPTPAALPVVVRNLIRR
ncbi:MAG TPA: hypothetical protein VM597_06120 [Gemmataceae bacterium]|jgi:hypothetical protein|nr:hypothetical protein [Gemmataceae bacterium]